jgi:hypothetical protein
MLQRITKTSEKSAAKLAGNLLSSLGNPSLSPVERFITLGIKSGY